MAKHFAFAQIESFIIYDLLITTINRKMCWELIFGEKFEEKYDFDSRRIEWQAQRK